MEDCIKRDEQQILDCQEHRRTACILIGWLDAEPDYWKSQQNKISIIGSNRTFEKQEDDLKNIRQRNDGRWEYRKVINGHQYHFINKSKTAVKDYASKITKMIKNALTFPKSNISFSDYAEEFFKTFKEHKASQSSKAEWLTALKVFKENFNKPFREYSPNDFQKFLNKLCEEAPNTAKKTYNKICAICRKAFLSNIIKINIAEIIEKPEFTENTRRSLTILEQVRFLNYLKREDQDTQNFCLFCLITSARRQEAYRYKAKDFNRRNMTLFINGTKTLNAPRTIKVSNAFGKILESIGSGFKHTADFYSRKAKDIFIKMNSPDLTLNCLRHTCATNMVYLGIPSEYRKHIMGHSTIVTTDRVYTHIELGIKKSRVELIYKGLYFTDF